MIEETITLFRPVGSEELLLIEKAGFRAFPPRLPEQPIFYPVLNEEYATKIAKDWNARLNADRVGYVTKFQVRSSFLSAYEPQIVGSSEHMEYWIPADELEEFNANIIGQIEILAEYRDS